MGIEIRPPAALSSAPGKTPVDDGRGRTQGVSARGEAPSVSFLSLLGAMGDGVPADLQTEKPDLPADVEAMGALPTDALPADTLAVDPRPVDAWPAAAVPPGAMAAVPAVPQDPGVATMARQPECLPAPSATTVGERSGPSVPQPGVAQPANPIAGHRADVAAGGEADPEASDAVQSLATAAERKGGRALQHAAADSAALQGQTDRSAAPVSARDFMARIEAARVAADSVAPRISAANAGPAPSAAPQVASMFDVSAAGSRSGTPTRMQDRVHAKATVHGAGAGFVAWGDATPAGTSHGASAVYAPGAMTPAPATAMAEKMHYWVSRGVQSAELQLDAFAGGSVDVSISVKGDVATVEFRTDQPQARQLLQDAMPQLKDLLASEGLMLSGGFVGGSMTQEGSPSRDWNGQPGAIARVAAGPAPVLESAGPSPVATMTAAGRSVDLFV